jgi:hypothetical protein
MKDTKLSNFRKIHIFLAKIPCDNQIRQLLDGVKPQEIYPVFEEIEKVLIQQGEKESIYRL